MPKNIAHNVEIRYGSISKLPIDKETKNGIKWGPDKSEVYEIIREKPNDEESRILKLKMFDVGGRLDFTVEY